MKRRGGWLPALLLVALLLAPALHCGLSRELPPLVVWVPGGGTASQRVEALMAELGIPGAILTDQEAFALRPRAMRKVRVVACFDGANGASLAITPLLSVLDSGGCLMLAGESAASLGGRFGYQSVPTTNALLRWEPGIRERLAPGSFDPGSGAALTYGYGVKRLPGWRWPGAGGTVWARDEEGVPRWIEFARGPAQVVAVGLPLAGQATHGDSQQARLFLERAAERAGLPRLWPTPKGQGALLVNVHVDSGLHLTYAEAVLRAWPRAVRGTFHVSAGPDCDADGDGKGVDAAGKGARWMPRLAEFGEIGSHGGWTHNLWVKAAPNWSRRERESRLERNFQALSRWSSGRSFSSPGGYQPRSINPWLERRGVRAYYHTGEGGGPPTRTWQDGEPFSASMWAFPLTSLGGAAATYEFKAEGIDEDRVSDWMAALRGFCESRRETRMVYGHMVDFHDMPRAYQGLLGSIAEAVEAGRMATWTMGEYAEFLDRRAGVRWSFDQGTLRAAGASLKDCAFRLPGRLQAKPQPGIEVRQDQADTWVVVHDARTALEVALWP